MLDADFVGNPTMREEMTTLVESMKGSEEKVAYVLAAFESVEHEDASEDAPVAGVGEKKAETGNAEDSANDEGENHMRRLTATLPHTQAELLQHLRKGLVRPVHQEKCAIAHRTTNYERWSQASTPYLVKYEYMYEPYVLLDKRIMPWYVVEKVVLRLFKRRFK
eukprot:TRINITY_DN2817_c1_g1_i4.p1 TRINITY_DN2817_c1_g1~~TRINITY_DN2817_c1_g1_i4.p1  ORF type:complete len:164 (+),score=24.74 TRINITY_DN2817_c1_g1_i4:810-1301(+)